MSIPAVSKVYMVTYPATLPKEGTVPVEEKYEALTNHLPALEIVGFAENSLLDENGQEVPGWSIECIGSMTAEEARQKYSVKYGDPVEIEEGYEWKCYEKGQWATPGLLARIRLIRVYKIPYRISAHSAIIDGHTNEYHIADVFHEPMLCPPLEFEANHWLVAENEKQLQEAKDSDGGAVSLHKDIAKGPGGWITTGFQEAYLQLLTRRENGTDKKAVEVGGKTKSPGFFQRLFGGGK